MPVYMILTHQKLADSAQSFPTESLLEMSVAYSLLSSDLEVIRNFDEAICLPKMELLLSKSGAKVVALNDTLLLYTVC